MQHPTPKSALFVIGTLGAGGAERQMVLLIEGLVRKGVHCEVFVLDGRGPLRQRLDRLQVPVHVASRTKSIERLKKLGNLATIAKAVLSLWWIARSTKPDVLQAYLPLTNFLGAVAGRLAGVPLIVTCRRGLGTHQDRHSWWWLFDHISNDLSHVVTVNSRAVADDTIARDGIAVDKLALIRNGLDHWITEPAQNEGDLRQSLGLGRDEIGFVNVANLIPYKGQADLLKAYAAAHRSLPPSKLFIIGRDDGIGPALKNLAAQLGISDKVVLTGARADVPRVLRVMDVFVLASHEEGSSNALLEAMATGLAVIATDVGGNREALEDGRFGLIVPARNPEALAEALTAIGNNPKHWRGVGSKAAVFARAEYSAEALSQKYLSLYQTSLK